MGRKIESYLHDDPKVAKIFPQGRTQVRMMTVTESSVSNTGNPVKGPAVTVVKPILDYRTCPSILIPKTGSLLQQCWRINGLFGGWS